MKITFIQTGGSIDKDYPRIKKSYSFEISEPAVKRVLEKINPNFTYDILELLKKDGLDITKNDRKNILKKCNEIKNDKIIITHGTDTMIDTAKVLSKIKNKTLILTGSVKPEKFSDSDAPINIGLAIAAVQILPNGIYIAMNGRIYEWNKCRKNSKCNFIDKF